MSDARQRWIDLGFTPQEAMIMVAGERRRSLVRAHAAGASLASLSRAMANHPSRVRQIIARSARTGFPDPFEIVARWPFSEDFHRLRRLTLAEKRRT